jgi:hypothetical protein
MMSAPDGELAQDLVGVLAGERAPCTSRAVRGIENFSWQRHLNGLGSGLEFGRSETSRPYH